MKVNRHKRQVLCLWSGNKCIYIYRILTNVTYIAPIILNLVQMGVVRKSITFTEQQDVFIKSLIEQGFYTNDSEYIRDVIRKDQESRKHIVDLQEALIDGIESGPSDATISSIWDEAIKEYEQKK